MAQCQECGREVGCPCNLHAGGLCASCLGKNSGSGDDKTTKKKYTKRIVYKNQKNAPANTEFSEILKTSGMSREEKLKRINDILEKAKL